MANQMSGALLTVEEAAEELKLHPKTVLRHIREGRLVASRVGKAYRIERARLDTFAGRASVETRGDAGARATVIVELPHMTVEAAERMATFLGATALTGDGETRPLHLTTAFDPITGSLKIVLVAAPADAARLLALVEMRLEP